MANEHLGILPTGLSAEDFTYGDSLLDYTPPNVQWQAPLAQKGESVFANYVKAHPDLLKTYNRRLARPEGSTGALPMVGGRPQSMQIMVLGIGMNLVRKRIEIYTNLWGYGVIQAEARI